MILVFIAEIPYEVIVSKKINYIPLSLNLLFPLLFMFLSTYNISVPGRENIDIIKGFLEKIIFKKEELNYQLKTQKPSSIKTILFSFLYILAFFISFSLIIWVLIWLKFNIISGILFFVFFSTVNFFAYRISQNATEISMIKQGGGIFELINDFFSIPFIKLGQMLSSSFSKINVFLFIFDTIIEMPFKTILEFLDEWSVYAKEKKRDILNE